MVASIATFGRTLARPASIWNLLCGTCLALTVGWVLAVARGSRRSESPEAIVEALDVIASLGAMIAPGALGSVLAWSVFDLLLCPFAALLPAIRRQAFLGLACAGIAISAATAWWAIERSGSGGPLSFAALALLGYSSAVCAMDPGWRARRVNGAWLVAALGCELYFAPECLSLLESAPWLWVPVCLLASSVLLALPFTRGAMRARASDPEARRAPSFRDDSDWVSPELRTGGRASARWSSARVLASPDDWVRASLYEANGYLRGGWVSGLVGTALFWTVVLAAISWFAGFAEHGELSGGVPTLRTALWGDDPHSAGPLGLPWSALILPSFATLYHVASALGPNAAPMYPLSRSDRAEVVWRTAAVQNFGLVFSFVLLLCVSSGVVEWISEDTQRSRLVPEAVRVAASMAIFVPIAQWFRVRFAQGATRYAGPVFVGALVGIPGLFLAIPIVNLALFWRRTLDDLPPAVQVGTFVALLAASQAIWRAVLVRHYRTRDLG